MMDPSEIKERLPAKSVIVDGIECPIKKPTQQQATLSMCMMYMNRKITIE